MKKWVTEQFQQAFQKQKHSNVVGVGARKKEECERQTYDRREKWHSFILSLEETEILKKQRSMPLIEAF